MVTSATEGPSIARSLLRFAWLLVKCGLLGAFVALLLALPHLYRRVDEEVRRRVQQRLAGCYPYLRVEVRSASLVPGKGIQVRGIRLTEPAAHEGSRGAGGPLVEIEEAFLFCDTRLEELVQHDPRITCVVLRRAKVCAWRRPDGGWNLEALLPLPKVGDGTCQVRVEQGELELWASGRAGSSPLVWRNLEMEVVPEGGPGSSGQGGLRHFRGSVTGEAVRRIEFQGTVAQGGQRWTLVGRAEGIQWSSDLRRALPPEWAERLGLLASLRAQGELEFRAAQDPSKVPAVDFEVKGQLSEGRLDDPRLPVPLTDLRASVVCNTQGIVVRNVFARSGQTSLQLSYTQAGYAADAPRTVHLLARNLALDARWLDVLPEAIQIQWPKYLPSGQVNVEATLSYDGQGWQPEVSLECLDVSFTYYKFRYRLEHATGTVRLKDDVLRVNVTGYRSNQPVRLSAEVLAPLHAWHGTIEARAEALPLDDRLLAALPENVRKTLERLHPSGTLQALVRVWRDSPQDAVHRYVHAVVEGGTLRYDRFAYPLVGVRGIFEMRDDHWTFRELEAVNDTGRFRARGHLIPTPQGHELRLWLSGEEVSLEEELRDALPAAMQQVWNDLRPQGVVDVQADVRYETGREHPEVLVRAWPRGQGVSIQPVPFPYRIERLQGGLVYQDGSLVFKRLKGEHGEVRVSAGGRCDFPPDGSFRLVLEGLDVDRLRLDRDLLQALPSRLKRVVAELDPEGPIHLAGDVVFARAAPGAPLTAQWDLALQTHQATLECGLKLENIAGELRLAGHFDGEHLACRGELDIDALLCRDVQWTQIRGPVWIDDQRVLFGTWADRVQPAEEQAASFPPAESKPGAPRPITAKLFNGLVRADGWVMLGPEPQFGIQAEYAGGELECLAREMLPGPQDLKGRIAGNLVLRGKGRNLNDLEGHGSVALRDADIYELPLMVAMLKILSIRRPDRTAFSTADIEFHIAGNHFYFDRLRFQGDAISLVGQGEMNMQREIKLTFHALVGRADQELPVVEQVLGRASQQLMLMHVGGTLQKPEVRRQPFPGVNQALQHLQTQRGLNAERRLPRKFW